MTSMTMVLLHGRWLALGVTWGAGRLLGGEGGA